jgi:serine/threonine protein kinase
MECLNSLKELMWGAHLLHEKYNLIHRSIVPANLHIDQNNQLRLASYFSCLPCYGPDGHAAYLHKGVRRAADAEEAFEEGEFEVGEFTAPEVLRGQPYNYLVDFYAIGVIVRKMYEVSQAHERVPVSQNNENLMMTMINRLTSHDLHERQAIAAEIIEDIEGENLEGTETPLGLSGLLLQDIKVGRPIEPVHSKKFIESEENGNGVDLDIITNYFRKPKAKAALMRPSKKPAPKRKEKQSVKNSREKSEKGRDKSEKGRDKSEKSHSKASADSQLDPQRRLSKKKAGSLSKDSLTSHSREREGPVRKEESPAKRPSKSKSHEKRKKE